MIRSFLQDWRGAAVFFGGFMFLISQAERVFEGRPFTLLSVVVGLLIWGAAGLFFGWTMRPLLNRKGQGA